MSDEIDLAPVAETPAPAAEPAARETPEMPQSRRDAIREAVERQKERAAPKEGANPNAPPKTAVAKPATAPQGAEDRPRTPDGKFAPAGEAATKAPSETAAQTPVQEAEQKPATEGSVLRPPSSWAPAAKVAFDGLPDVVKAEIEKREGEVRAGFAKLQEYKGVEKFAEMAKRGGTTLDRALENYVGVENLLRRDVFAGVEQILRNVGIDPRSFVTAYQQRLATGNRTPNSPASDAANRTAAIDPQSIIRQAQEAARAEIEARQVQSEIERFAADPKNRFYENVRPQMVKLVQAGLAASVQEAYDLACRMDPEISRLINQPQSSPDPRRAADQARAAARATVGAPSPGTSTPAKGIPSNATRREVIRAAIEAQRTARA